MTGARSGGSARGGARRADDQPAGAHQRRTWPSSCPAASTPPSSLKAIAVAATARRCAAAGPGPSSRASRKAPAAPVAHTRTVPSREAAREAKASPLGAKATQLTGSELPRAGHCGSRIHQWSVFPSERAYHRGSQFSPLSSGPAVVESAALCTQRIMIRLLEHWRIEPPSWQPETSHCIPPDFGDQAIVVTIRVGVWSGPQPGTVWPGNGVSHCHPV